MDIDTEYGDRDIDYRQLKWAAQQATPDDLVGLLKAYGDKRRNMFDPVTCYQVIAAGVENHLFGPDAEKKRSLLIDYKAKRGDFAVSVEVPLPLMGELLAAVQEITLHAASQGVVPDDVRKLAEIAARLPQPPRAQTSKPPQI